MITDEQIISACSNAKSMASACASLGMNFQTFRKRAKLLGVFVTNQSGKGINKPQPEGVTKFILRDILEGKHPQYSSHKLRVRLIADGLKKDECEECGIGNVWNGKPLSMHLDHIDGNHHNHLLENLRILCPNCHTQTATYGSKNMGSGPVVKSYAERLVKA